MAGADRLSRSASTPGAILQPHPPPWESDVSRGADVARSVALLLESPHVKAGGWSLEVDKEIRQQDKCGAPLPPASEPRWRKAAGVEPTRKRLTPPSGFEAQPHHRVRVPSIPAAVCAQHVRIVHAARVTDAIEELQDLDRTLAAEPDGVAIARGIDGAVFARQRGYDIGQLVDLCCRRTDHARPDTPCPA